MDFLTKGNVSVSCLKAGFNFFLTPIKKSLKNLWTKVTPIVHYNENKMVMNVMVKTVMVKKVMVKKVMVKKVMVKKVMVKKVMVKKVMVKKVMVKKIFF